jgi:type I restriction enzyme S subunit
MYYLNFSDLNKYITGSTRGKLTKSSMNKIQIPLPPLPIQQKIAAVLDKADAIRRRSQQILAKYDQLAKSVFLEMFGDPVKNEKGWDLRRLNEVCVKITDGTHHSPPAKDFGHPYVTAKHVKPFKLEFESKPTFISTEYHEEIYKRCPAEFGDVLYIKDGATTGIACINTFKEPISLLSSLALLKLKAQILNNWFLCYWFNHQGIKDKLISEYMAGAAIKRYTLKKINSFDVPIPPIQLQNQFASIIAQIEKQKAQTQAELDKAKMLYQSLLHRAFSGDLFPEN